MGLAVIVTDRRLRWSGPLDAGPGRLQLFEELDTLTISVLCAPFSFTSRNWAVLRSRYLMIYKWELPRAYHLAGKLNLRPLSTYPVVKRLPIVSTDWWITTNIRVDCSTEMLIYETYWYRKAQSSHHCSLHPLSYWGSTSELFSCPWLPREILVNWGWELVAVVCWNVVSFIVRSRPTMTVMMVGYIPYISKTSASV